jgi:hypothetical protein
MWGGATRHVLVEWLWSSGDLASQVFYETFNDAGDGVPHVNLIWAERSRCLGFTGQVVSCGA